MNGATAEALSAIVLAVVLVLAVVRPRGLNEGLGAAPGALLVIAAGALSWSAAWSVCRGLLPTVIFLALILVFAHLCAEEGVFRYLAYLAGRGSRGDPRRLLLLVVGIASVVTAVLTLDSTVVLLTPVIVATVARLRVDGRPSLYSCIRLANSGSLLLPVSNLTNLLAFPASGLSFARFTAVMAVPWLVAVVGEWLALRLRFRAALRSPATGSMEPVAAPVYALAVTAAALAGFVVASAIGQSPAWAAGLAATALAAPRLIRRQSSPLELAKELNLGFAVFVLSLGVIVAAVAQHGLASGLAHLLPRGGGLLSLLGIALLAGALANAVNNIPATLVLLPLVSGSPAAVLAMLIGVNVGPNATYIGSLATLLWRRRLPTDLRPRAREFHLLGVIATPAILVAATVGLWVSVSVLGV
jgi:arsenical pump membrane protein